MATVAKLAESGSPPPGLHLLTGGTAKVKFQNLVRNLRERRIVVVQAGAEKVAA